MPTDKNVCPSCGFEVFDEPPGSYDICSLCGWEDDHVQLAHPSMGGGANKLSLAEHQSKAIKTYPVGVELVGGYRRSKAWRPLQPQDVVLGSGPTDGRSYFNAAAEEATPYYWLRLAGG